MLLSLFAAVLAATPAEVAGRHPGPYTVQQEPGGALVVHDGKGETLSTHEALLLARGEEVAAKYRANRGARKAGAVLLWGAGGVAASAGLLRSMWDDDGTGLGVAAAGVAGTVGGFVLLYAPKQNQLSWWTDPDSLQATLDRRYGAPQTRPAAVAATPAPPPSVVQARPLTPPKEEWRVEAGHIERAGGGRVSIPEIAAELGDDAKAKRFKRWQDEQYATWGAVAGGGMVAAAVGAAMVSAADDTEHWRAGVGTVGVGAALTVGGCVGIGLASARQQNWFTEEELREAVDQHDQGVGAIPTEARRVALTVHPQIAPGWVGLSGTF